jgi:SAM-dependent methyltransferase
MKLYGELAARWYRLVDPVGDHLDEAACYEAALLRAASVRPETLLELGAGAGNNAFYLKRRFRCTLTDLSPDMLALSRDLNPECEHLVGDMRTLRLGTSFDLVFVHDAVNYLTAEQDLRAMAETAFVHTRPGGAALFAPDFVKESFKENSELLDGEEGDRALRCVEWMWDPDPNDTTITVDYVFVLREHGTTTVHHDQHIEGLFSRATWLHILEGVGYSVEVVEGTRERLGSEMFLCRRALGTS